MFESKPYAVYSWRYYEPGDELSYLLIKVSSIRELSRFERLSNHPSFWSYIPNAVILRGEILAGSGTLKNYRIHLRISKTQLKETTEDDLLILGCRDHYCSTVSQCPASVNCKNFDAWIKQIDDMNRLM